MRTVSDYFGSLVFDDRVMRAKLPSDVYASLKRTIDEGASLDAHVADKLLRDGRVRLKDCKSAKGKTYNATVLLSCEADGRSKFSLEFEGGC